jgi:multiple sugar transport system permease protein
MRLITLRRGEKGLLQRREALYGFLFIAPALLGMLIFNLGPIVAALFFSFTKYSIIAAPKWAGAANYQKAFGESLVSLSFENTAYYAVISVPLGIGLAFAVGMLLNRIKGAHIYRTAYYVPCVVPSVAAAVIWLVMLNPNVGLVNYFISLFGVKGPGWLIDPDWAKPGLILMSLWSIGTGMVLYLAGLQSVPEHLYEAAEIDGARPLRRFWAITVPMMTPTLFFHLVMGLIASFQAFNAPFIMTQGGPVKSTYFVSLLIYDNAFRYFKMGYAAAISWILFVLVLVLTLIVLKTSKSWVYYEGGARGRF